MISIMQNTPFLIIANGPSLTEKRIQTLSIGKTIVALDGAIEQLEKIKILLAIILGDFDSVSEKTRRFVLAKPYLSDLKMRTPRLDKSRGMN